MNRLEIGGDFHWIVNFPAPFLKWPDQPRWFARGRDAVAAVLTKNVTATSPRLFVPGFFCDEVVCAWQDFGLNVVRYTDYPGHFSPEYPESTPTSSDVVLIVNYFGVDERRDWAQSISDSFGAITLEDHTHDPFSPWAKNSTADYAMASIRKTCPVSDGAIVWSPGKHSLRESSHSQHVYSDLHLLAAMALKSTYLNSENSTPEQKNEFRRLQAMGHETLDNSGPLLGVSPWSFAVLSSGYPDKWRQQRILNGRHLIDRLQKLKWPPLLFSDWQKDQCPFAIVLKFENTAKRDAVRNALSGRHVYTPVHWLAKNSPDKSAIKLGSRLLSLPIDHRYDEKDMDFIADAISDVRTETG